MINNRVPAVLMMSESTPGKGFTPGANILGVKEPPTFIDAADILIDSKELQPPSLEPGLLILADGTRFKGQLFGADTIAMGELVFTTGMCGYQESLTDPSFAGQVLTFTWPLLGNYGVHRCGSESSSVWPRGVVCRELMKIPDHRDSIGSVHDLLLSHGVPGIEGIDTRSLTRRVREHGTVLCVFGPVEKEQELIEILENLSPPDQSDLVAEVTCTESIILNEGATDIDGNPFSRLAAIDCGIKFNILRELCTRFEVVWCPADMNFDEIIEQWSPDAFFSSNGPGDPAHPGSATIARETLAAAVRKDFPVMGICLGHQLMGLAAGLRTYKLRYGHRGANQPVMDLESKRVYITSQNHGFAVEDPEQGMLAPHPSGACSEKGTNVLGADFKVRYINSNDRTVEGLDLVGKSSFTVQFHPEARPGPLDAAPLFDRFSDIVNKKVPTNKVTKSLRGDN